MAEEVTAPYNLADHDEGSTWRPRRTRPDRRPDRRPTSFMAPVASGGDPWLRKTRAERGFLQVDSGFQVAFLPRPTLITTNGRVPFPTRLQGIEAWQKPPPPPRSP